MENKEKYASIFVEVFEAKPDEVSNLQYQHIKAWDSVGHMSLVAALEDAFDILLDTDDIISLNSYEKGMSLLNEKYGIDFS